MWIVLRKRRRNKHYCNSYSMYYIDLCILSIFKSGDKFALFMI